MSVKVEENLSRMVAREMRAAARYAAFMLKAEQEGKTELAMLFRVAADAKSVHARRFLNLLRGKIGGGGQNLKEALESESRGLLELYPGMVQEAGDSPKAVKKAFGQSMKTDGELATLYEHALQDGDKEGPRLYYVCQICGHIHRDSLPKRCPVCRAVPGRFKRIE
jgi:rubrerythrin